MNTNEMAVVGQPQYQYYVVRGNKVKTLRQVREERKAVMHPQLTLRERKEVIEKFPKLRRMLEDPVPNLTLCALITPLDEVFVGVALKCDSDEHNKDIARRVAYGRALSAMSHGTSVKLPAGLNPSFESLIMATASEFGLQVYNDYNSNPNRNQIKF